MKMNKIKRQIPNTGRVLDIYVGRTSTKELARDHRARWSYPHQY